MQSKAVQSHELELEVVQSQMWGVETWGPKNKGHLAWAGGGGGGAPGERLPWGRKEGCKLRELLLRA